MSMFLEETKSLFVLNVQEVNGNNLINVILS